MIHSFILPRIPDLIISFRRMRKQFYTSFTLFALKKNFVGVHKPYVRHSVCHSICHPVCHSVCHSVPISTSFVALLLHRYSVCYSAAINCSRKNTTFLRPRLLIPKLFFHFPSLHHALLFPARKFHRRMEKDQMEIEKRQMV